MTAESSQGHLVWLDLEMTGLDTFHDQIIEIATIITDARLNIIAEGPVLAIHQDEAILAAMDDWNQKQHGGSGLLTRVRSSTLSCAEAEQQTLAFIKKFLPAKASPMCGNSICQDRRFLARLMPELEDFFHYRNLDVSTIKELVTRWYPENNRKFQKKSSHLALDDVRESIAELKFYREHFFVSTKSFLP